MAHHQCWSFTKAPLEYPAVALGHGVPQDHSLHRPLQVIVRADGSVSQLKALDSVTGITPSAQGWDQFSQVQGPAL